MKYRPDLPAAGEYYIYASWTRSANRATNVPFDIFSKTGDLLKTVRVNERSTGGSGFVLLGEFKLHSETPSFVRIRNTGTTGEVIANAIEFLPAGDVKGKAPKTVAITRAATADVAPAIVAQTQKNQSEIELLRDEVD